VKIERDDLSVRARRGELDEGGEKQLVLWLSSSQEASLVHRAGLQFDAEDSVLAGDEALAQRIAERVLANRPLPLAPRRVWLKPALGVGGLGVVALALLSPSVRQRWGATSPTTVTSTAPAHPRVKAPAAVVASPPAMQEVASSLGKNAKDSIAPSRATSAQQRALPRGAAERAVAAPRDSAATTIAGESASELFGRANRARREARSELALSLYRHLQQQYPTSAEALSAEMALGMLELKANRAEPALRHFSAYLTRSPQGGLAPEALWGQAQALSGLGRSAAAAESLRLLLKRFPGSAYASAARAKLEAAP
jgi:TolA-binding protein